jgi:hypothetical protein
MQPELLEIHELKQFHVYEIKGDNHVLDFYVYLGKNKSDFYFIRYIIGGSYTTDYVSTMTMDYIKNKSIKFKPTQIEYIEKGDYK